MVAQGMSSAAFVHMSPPGLTNFCSTLDTGRRQFNLGMGSQDWSLAGRAVLLAGPRGGEDGDGAVGVGVEEGGGNLIDLFPALHILHLVSQSIHFPGFGAGLANRRQKQKTGGRKEE